VGYAGTSNQSSITPGALEGSNVDLSEEFTNMIIAQRGFQANARIITTADEMLSEVVQLRR
jgi:flagellar hook protein FlgE